MFVITAPTASISSQLVRHLLDAGAPVRVVARDPARLAPDVAERVEIVRGSHRDPAVVAAALPGAEAVFWLVPPDPRAETLEAAFTGFSRAAVEGFTAHRVGRVVGVSALGRDTPVADRAGYTTAARAMDDLIAATGVPYRALTMPSFMDNVLRQVVPITTRGLFTGPYEPDVAMPSIATRDIAEAAARVLLDDTWTGFAEVPLLGPEDLTYDRMAAVMADVLGRPVRYQQLPVAEVKAGALRTGASEAMAQGRIDMALAKNAGLDNGVPRTPENTTPTTFRQWCLDVLKPAADA
ncbi:NAD(P)H-binding protein [Actinoplanes sp. N902-109]|uniref:NAD(P)H-binding protein n=1 Tax=Actinoplanes sp. (strain N902-109) TaxID=649831 RepID=UPI000329580E|nr:NAD(P)H-binding protein [Actinoplanes sp. N902-109]AGL15186.1 NmrA family protein [Actinoplanes sp. N902-109]